MVKYPGGERHESKRIVYLTRYAAFEDARLGKFTKVGLRQAISLSRRKQLVRFQPFVP